MARKNPGLLVVNGGARYSLWQVPATSIAAKSAELTDQACDALAVLFQDVPTDVLEAIAEDRDGIHEDGWMQRAIRGYIEAWR